jgi:hypothetical protein
LTGADTVIVSVTGPVATTRREQRAGGKPREAKVGIEAADSEPINVS